MRKDIASMRQQRARDIYVAVTHTSHTMDNTGIQRVTRCLCRALEEDYPAVSFVSWSEDLQTLQTLDLMQASRLSAYGGPMNCESRTDLSKPPAWIGHLPVPRAIRRRIREAWRRKHAHFRIREGGFLVIPEWLTGEQMAAMLAFAKVKDLTSVCIFHDAIAIDHPDLVSAKYRENHYEYMRQMTYCDLVVANSRDSRERFDRFVREEGLGRPSTGYVELAGEITGGHRETFPNMDYGNGIHALCVGSLDPRKNHQCLLDAFALLWEEHPDLDLHLTLVGGVYDETNPLCRMVTSACERWPKLKWLGRVPDDVLTRAYQDCHFTCFPSLVEGFGIPILESIWHGRPCICSREGIMGELAGGGGCVAVDVRDPASIADAVLRLATERAAYESLAREALGRPIKTWKQFGREFVSRISGESS